MQISYVSLDVDVLCSVDNPSLQLVMREWGESESPPVYWYKKFKDHFVQNSLEDISLDYFFFGNPKLVPLIHGLPVKEAISVCKEFYNNNIAKVTIEISQETVLMTRRDFSVTFAEQLSIISM